MTPTTLAAGRCLRCGKEIKERWTDLETPLCATCALEAELFDREGRSA